MLLWKITALYSKKHIKHKCVDKIQMQTFLTWGEKKKFTEKTLIRDFMPNEFVYMFYGVQSNYTKDTKCTKLFCYAYISTLVKNNTSKLPLYLLLQD